MALTFPLTAAQFIDWLPVMAMTFDSASAVPRGCTLARAASLALNR
jgi:hypothetical protein